ncbi:uncharacterized protein LOC127535394 isoform X2 [Acanthochromis polyacanthus]|uniref:uncharacterized protein LOC127535394 isoform X2 n=1 Tax=Acanthochromis polyacanthus TaxID=80966 RepID=UPI002234AAA1|nr:uncharacterized protein LOC127535394 isoform X2 [Acanthochromis polyacanthus]
MDTFNIQSVGGVSGTTPGVGRGRGVARWAPQLQSTPMSQPALQPGPSVVRGNTHEGLRDDVVRSMTFTPGMSTLIHSSQNTGDAGMGSSPNQLAELIRTIGAEIGESIKASLQQNCSSDQTLPVTPDQTQQACRPDQSTTTVIDASKLNLVLRSDVNVPPYFRGDGSDKYSICEWEELMRSYLMKQGYSSTECIEEVMNRLLGKARDVTKVWLRSNPSVSDVNVVYGVLRRHFGDVVHSDLPLADFYAVQPFDGETALDYWIRLNKAAEMTEQCLVSKGEPATNLSRHAVIMFVRNCPDKELALIFKTKPPRDWSAQEVQEHIDNHGKVQMFCGSQMSVQKETTVGLGQEGMCSDTLVSQPFISSPKVTSDNEDKCTMDRVLNLLERTLTSNVQLTRGQSQNKGRQINRECKVCNSPDHSTSAHCRMYNLCFRCYLPGHIGAKCKQLDSTQPSDLSRDSRISGN